MTPFEQELKRALARREPGSDFTAQVLAKAGESERPAKRAASNWKRWFLPVAAWRYVAYAAVVVLLVAAGVAHQRQERRQRGEAAKQQLLTALQIAGSQLHQAQLRVKRTQFPEVLMQ